VKIAVVNNCVPFLAGGAEALADELVRKLNEHGHDAMLVRYPFAWHPPERIHESMLACSMMRIPNVDRVIGLKFPAYYVPHENKVLWLLHQFRQAYDLWGTPHQDLPDDMTGVRIRDSVRAADDALLRRARKIYTLSDVTRDRLRKFNGIESDVLFHPLPNQHPFVAREYGDYVFCASRMSAGKRQTLLIDAMKHVRTPVRLVLAGQIESPYSEELLRARIAAANLAGRVVLLPGYLPESEKNAYIERALAGVYVPIDEDSYGYVTLEHFSARKAVVTCTDSGGTHILVKDGTTGFVVEPRPEALADAIDRLYADRELARSLGKRAFELVAALDVTWDNVVAKLTS
jgi:glycosyltransferase involved in cell wall biosynthesis